MSYSSGTKVGTEWHSGNIGTPILLGSFGRITAQSDGIFTLFNNAQSAFSKLQFGGTSNAFPSLDRSGQLINFNLADGSGRAGARVATLGLNAGALSDGTNFTLGGTTQATIGANGAAAALTALPLGYLICFAGAVKVVIPYYNG